MVCVLRFVLGRFIWQLRPACGLVISASASVLVGREFDSAESYQDLKVGTAAFLPGVPCTEEL